MNKKGPCLEKNCAWCCDPVKVWPGTPIPKDEKGEELRKALNEIRVDENHPDTVKLVTYICKNFDKKTGLCVDYDNRPSICRKTTCIDEEKSESSDDQHKKVVNTKFFKCKK